MWNFLKWFSELGCISILHFYFFCVAARMMIAPPFILNFHILLFRIFLGIFTGKLPMLESLFWQSYKTCNLINEESLTLVFSCQYCEIFENTYFDEHLRTAASEIIVWLFIRFFSALNFSSKFVSNLHFTKSDLWKPNICLCNILIYTCTPNY